MSLSRQHVVTFSQYVASGGTAFALEYATFIGLVYGLHVAVVGANIASFGVGLLTSFTLNRYWVFKGGLAAGRRQFGLYVTLALFNLVVTSLLLVGLKRIGIEPAIAKLLVMGVIVLWNFGILRTVVFKR